LVATPLNGGCAYLSCSYNAASLGAIFPSIPNRDFDIDVGGGGGGKGGDAAIDAGVRSTRLE